jgi:hypothetical protein
MKYYMAYDEEKEDLVEPGEEYGLDDEEYDDIEEEDED